MRFEKLLLAAAALCLVCMAPACSDDDPATDPEQNETPGTPGEGEGDGDDDSGEPGEPNSPQTTLTIKVLHARLPKRNPFLRPFWVLSFYLR